MSSPQTTSAPLRRKYTFKPLVVDEEKIAYLWEQVLKFPFVFDDVTKGSFEHFMNVILSPNHVMFEVGEGDGLITISDVVPGVTGSLHFIFFDRNLKDKDEVIMDVVRHAMQLLDLHRVSFMPPEDRVTAMATIKRLGFQREGRIRQIYPRNGKFLDVYVYGILREEVL